MFFHQCRSLSSSSFKNFYLMIHSGFRTFTGTKTTNMRNRNSLGLSRCFSCRSFACPCLASLSRNHIFDVLTGRRKCDQSVQKTLNFYRLSSNERKTSCTKRFLNNSWHIYCENHPLMNLANSYLSNISPSQLWTIYEQYPDLAKHLQQHVRLMGQLGLNNGVPWLSNANGALLLSANRKPRTSTILQLIAQSSKRNSSVSVQI